MEEELIYKTCEKCSVLSRGGDYKIVRRIGSHITVSTIKGTYRYHCNHSDCELCKNN